MRIPSQLPPIVRSTSPIREASEERPSRGLRTILCLSVRRPRPCPAGIVYA